MNTLYTPEHEWLTPADDGSYTVGITDHAQQALGDIVFVDLPKLGAKLSQGATAGVIESVKAAADVYAPVSGEVLAINEALNADPALINQSPQDKGWLFRIKPSAVAELDKLLDEAAYKSLL